MGGSLSVLYAIAAVSMLALAAVAVSATTCLSIPGSRCTVDPLLAAGLAVVLGVALLLVWFGSWSRPGEFG